MTKDSEMTLSFIADAYALPGGHLVLVVLLHPDAVDPEVVGAARDRDPPAPSTRVYTYKQQQHRSA